MPSANDWLVARERIAESAEPRRSPHFRALYQLAIADAELALRTYRRIDPARRADLVHDLLATRLDEILGADSPRALFVTSLTRLAIQWMRRKDADVAEMPADEAPAGQEDPTRGIELEQTIAMLTPRERSVVLAIAIGEDRDEIARVHDTTRQNVDQIVSRARRRLQKDGLERGGRRTDGLDEHGEEDGR